MPQHMHKSRENPSDSLERSITALSGYSHPFSLSLKSSSHGTNQGPTGGPELLCLLGHNAASQGFWYGYVCRHPQRDVFVSMIVFMMAFVDAPDDATLFARFDYWARKRLKYDPCLADGFEEVYCESGDLVSAATSLKTMISNRRSSRRFIGADTRIIDVLGMRNFKDENGVYPSCP
jgi:hypothetical protein